MASNYNFMKTGSIGDEPIDPELILNVSSLVSVFASNAIETSAKYVEHSGRNIVTPMDIKLCLMVETFKFLEEDNTEKIQKHKQMIQEDIRKELQGEISESSDEEDEDEQNENEDDEEIFTKSTCQCNLCQMVNTIEDKWKDWVPQTPLEKSIKKNIDEIPLV